MFLDRMYGVTPMFDTSEASCKGRNTKVFFPDSWQGRASSIPAKRICRDCPVKQKCLEYAIENGIHHGVWGGMNPYERARFIGQPRKQIH